MHGTRYEQVCKELCIKPHKNCVPPPAPDANGPQPQLGDFGTSRKAVWFKEGLHEHIIELIVARNEVNHHLVQDQIELIEK